MSTDDITVEEEFIGVYQVSMVYICMVGTRGS